MRDVLVRCSVAFRPFLFFRLCFFGGFPQVGRRQVEGWYETMGTELSPSRNAV